MPFKIASGDVQIARMLGASGEHNRVELAAQIFDRNILADLGAGNKFHALSRHLFQAAINDVFL